MALVPTTFLYTMTAGGTDQYTVNGQVLNGQAIVDATDNTISVNEVVSVDFSTQNALDGDFTYLGREPTLPGAVAQSNTSGLFYLFSNQEVLLNQNFNILAVDIVIPPSIATVSVYTDDTLTSVVQAFFGPTAFDEALAIATTGQAISVDDPATLGDVGAQSVTVDGLTIISDAPFDAQLSLSSSAQTLTLSGTSDIDVVGNVAGSTITGNDGNNQLTAQGGVNVLDGGAGADTLVIASASLTGNSSSLSGGLGNDTLQVNESCNLGNMTISGLETLQIGDTGGGATTAIVSVTLAQLNSGFTDVAGRAGAIDRLSVDADSSGNADLSGFAYSNVESVSIHAQDGLDGTLTGASASGLKTYFYLDGADNAVGGSGSDIYYVNSVAVTISESSGTGGGTDLVQSSVSYTLADSVEQLMLTGVGNSGGTGNAGDNKLTGNSGNNVLDGLDGDDGISGGDGSDTLNGGAGSDILRGDGGNDRLDGGAGRDALFGGADADTFVLNTNTLADSDIFRDFVSGVDSVEVLGSLFGLAAGPLDPAAFAATADGKATTTDQHFIYNTTNGGLYFDADGTGASARVQVAAFTGAPTIVSTDFDII